MSLPDEITRRKERIEKLKKACAVIEAQARERAAEQQPEYEQKLADWERKKAEGKRRGGKPPQPPSATPAPGDQFNFTDPQSAIMKAGNGKHFVQAFNAQAAVDADGSMLIVGARVSECPNDKQQLAATVASIVPELGVPNAVPTDNGFYSAEQVALVEANGKTKVYAAVGKQSHHRTISDLEAHREPAPLAENATPIERMAHRLKTAAGKAIYKLRKETVEPVFGIIKEVMGFRRFSLRGHENLSLEWDLVTLSYNLKRLFTLKKRQTA